MIKAIDKQAEARLVLNQDLSTFMNQGREIRFNLQGRNMSELQRTINDSLSHVVGGPSHNAALAALQKKQAIDRFSQRFVQMNLQSGQSRLLSGGSSFHSRAFSLEAGQRPVNMESLFTRALIQQKRKQDLKKEPPRLQYAQNVQTIDESAPKRKHALPKLKMDVLQQRLQQQADFQEHGQTVEKDPALRAQDWGTHAMSQPEASYMESQQFNQRKYSQPSHEQTSSKDPEDSRRSRRQRESRGPHGDRPAQNSNRRSEVSQNAGNERKDAGNTSKRSPRTIARGGNFQQQQTTPWQQMKERNLAKFRQFHVEHLKLLPQGVVQSHTQTNTPVIGKSVDIHLQASAKAKEEVYQPVIDQFNQTKANKALVSFVMSQAKLTEQAKGISSTKVKHVGNRSQLSRQTRRGTRKTGTKMSFSNNIQSQSNIRTLSSGSERQIEKMSSIHIPNNIENSMEEDINTKRKLDDVNAWTNSAEGRSEKAAEKINLNSDGQNTGRLYATQTEKTQVNEHDDSEKSEVLQTPSPPYSPMKKGLHLTQLHSNEQILSDEVENIIGQPGNKTKPSSPRKSESKMHKTQLHDDSTTKSAAKPNIQSQSESMQSLKLKDDLDESRKKNSNKSSKLHSPKKIGSVNTHAHNSQPKIKEEVQAQRPGDGLGQVHKTVASNVSYGQTSMSVTETAQNLSPLYFQSRQAYEEYLRTFAGTIKSTKSRQYHILEDTPTAQDNHILIGTQNLAGIAHEKTNDSLFEGESKTGREQRHVQSRNKPHSVMAQTQLEEYLAPLSSIHEDQSYLKAFRNIPNSNQVILRPPRASPGREQSTAKRSSLMAPDRQIMTPFSTQTQPNEIRFSTVHGSRKKSHAHPQAQQSLEIQKVVQGIEQPPQTAQPRAMRFMNRRFTTQNHARTTNRDIHSEQISFRGHTSKTKQIDQFQTSLISSEPNTTSISQRNQKPKIKNLLKTFANSLGLKSIRNEGPKWPNKKTPTGDIGEQKMMPDWQECLFKQNLIKKGVPITDKHELEGKFGQSSPGRKVKEFEKSAQPFIIMNKTRQQSKIVCQIFTNEAIMNFEEAKKSSLVSFPKRDNPGSAMSTKENKIYSPYPHVEVVLNKSKQFNLDVSKETSQMDTRRSNEDSVGQEFGEKTYELDLSTLGSAAQPKIKFNVLDHGKKPQKQSSNWLPESQPIALTSRQALVHKLRDLDVKIIHATGPCQDRETLMTPTRRNSGRGELENTHDTHVRQHETQETALEAGPSAGQSHNVSNLHDTTNDRLEGVYQDQSMLSRHEHVQTDQSIKKDEDELNTKTEERKIAVEQIKKVEKGKTTFDAGKQMLKLHEHLASFSSQGQNLSHVLPTAQQSAVGFGEVAQVLMSSRRGPTPLASSRLASKVESPRKDKIVIAKKEKAKDHAGKIQKIRGNPYKQFMTSTTQDGRKYTQSLLRARCIQDPTIALVSAQRDSLELEGMGQSQWQQYEAFMLTSRQNQETATAPELASDAQMKLASPAPPRQEDSKIHDSAASVRPSRGSKEGLDKPGAHQGSQAAASANLDDEGAPTADIIVCVEGADVPAPTRNSHICIAEEGTEQRIMEIAFSPNPKMEMGDAKYEHDVGPFSPSGKAEQAAGDAEKAKTRAQREKWHRENIGGRAADENIESVTQQLGQGTRELGCGVDAGPADGESPIQYFRVDVITSSPHRLATQPPPKAKYASIARAGELRAQRGPSPGIKKTFVDKVQYYQEEAGYLRLLRHEQTLKQEQEREKAKAIPSDGQATKKDFKYRGTVEQSPRLHQSPRPGRPNIIHVRSNFPENDGATETIHTVHTLAASSPLGKGTGKKRDSEPGYSFDKTDESPALHEMRSPEDVGSQLEDMDDDVVSLLKTKSKYGEDLTTEQRRSLEGPAIDEVAPRGAHAAKVTTKKPPAER